MTVSVCMGTYNGEKYIREQLESIKNQTLQPDEVIICDDGSTDRTVELICAFFRRNGLSGGEPGEINQDGEKEKEEEKEAFQWRDAQGRIWKLFINKRNLGYPVCFYHTMNLCRGDIVFLSDQDDIWDIQKLEKMCTVFSEQDTMQALVCKFGLIDGDGNKLKTAMTPTHAGATAELRKVSVHDVFYKGEWPGMVMAYRREWYERKTEACREQSGELEQDNGLELEWRQYFGGYRKVLPHDLLVGAWAAEEGAFRQLDEELAWHRRHENNAGQEEHKITKLLHKERKLREIETYLKYLEVFRRENLMSTKEGQRALEEKRQSMSGRYEALCSGSVGKVLKNAFKNKKHVRLATVVCDVIICHQKTNEGR